MREGAVTPEADPSDCTSIKTEIRHVKLNRKGTVSDLARFYNSISTQESNTDITIQMRNRANSSKRIEQNINSPSSTVDTTSRDIPNANDKNNSNVESVNLDETIILDKQSNSNLTDEASRRFLNSETNNSNKNVEVVNEEPSVNNEQVVQITDESNYVENNKGDEELNQKLDGDQIMEAGVVDAQGNDDLSSKDAANQDGTLEIEDIYPPIEDISPPTEDTAPAIEDDVPARDVYVVPLNIGLSSSQRKIGEDDDLTNEVINKATEASSKNKSKKKSKRSKNRNEAKKSRKEKQKDDDILKEE